MATYASLSDEAKAVAQSTDRLIRSVCGSMGRVMNTLKGIADDSNAIAIVSSLDATEEIPNSSGLAGSDSLTKTELVAIWTTLNTLRSTTDTSGNRAAWSKAAGAPNLLGNG